MKTIVCFVVALVSAVLSAVSCSDAPSCNRSDSTDCDTLTSEDVVQDATGCKDERKFGDYKSPDDFCWAPPQKYCAQGAGWAITRACNADGSLCCEFASTCIPCGWTSCNDVPNDMPNDACTEFPTDSTLCSSGSLQADLSLVLCFDDVPTADR